MTETLDPGENGNPTGSSTSQASARIADWSRLLREHRQRLAHDPQFNPVKQLAFDLSRQIESGKLSQAEIVKVGKELCDRALRLRARATRRYMGELAMEKRDAELSRLVRESAFEQGVQVPFAVFADRWERPRAGIVFTGHPTFAMSKKLRKALVRLIEDEADEGALSELEGLAHAPDPEITLNEEHAQAQDAIGAAKDALTRLNRLIIGEARRLYPSDWRRLRPNAVQISSWVGYDLDGRTDVRWHDAVRLRLDEKRRQLERCRRALTGLDAPRADLNTLAARFKAEIEVLERALELFAAGPEEPAMVSRAANHLTRPRSHDLHVSIAPVLETVGRMIENAASDSACAELMALRSQLEAWGLGAARIHIRINAMQLFNAIRKPLGLDVGADLASRMLLRRLDALIAEAEPQSVNFASLAMEPTTAARQFIAMAQILKHIDGDAPIRLLIAECEHPFTVLAALYFAKLFGVADRVDISPLFETPRALDQGARLLEALLKTNSYPEYVKKRGRLCAQTGFSDAGRFVGQIPAALAIERLHGRFSDVLSRANLGDVEIVIFDTHGESIGRGCHPDGLAERLNYVMSPWARARFAERKLKLHHEVSFQGGDGYVLFGSAALAYAVIAELLKADAGLAAQSPPGCAEADGADAFYEQADFSRDYFEKVKDFQQRLFENPNYMTALGVFGVNLLPNAGSRKSRRQFDAGRDSRVSTAEMRAIPHNAILQQLGYLVHVAGGVGTALRDDMERFGDVYRKSSRTRTLAGLVHRAKQLSSIKTLVAYSSLFDDAFWVTRPLNDMEPHIKEPSLYLAGLLRGDPRHDGMMHLATLLREDAVYLHDLLRHVGLKTLWPHDDESRVELDLLHAVRIAVIQHIYLLAARVPPFSTRNDIARQDVMNLVLSLRIEEAGKLLRGAFPTAAPKLSDYSMEEPAAYTGEDGGGYAELNRNLIDPMLEAYRTVLELSVGVGHHFRAHG
jgi:phosphoenolpyruvate carboxylase